MRLPSYRKHSSGQARVSISGRDYLLGPYGSKESKAKYNRLIGEWLVSKGSGTFGVPSDQLTVSQVLFAYLKHAKEYYGTKASSELHRIKPGLSAMRSLYGSTPATSFGPLQFRAVREHLAREGSRSRQYVNRLADRIKRMLKWAASESLVPAQNVQAICMVQPFLEGRTSLHETEDIGPVPDDVVEATLPHLSRVIADMVRFQLLTGCCPYVGLRSRPICRDRASVEALPRRVLPARSRLRRSSRQ